MIKNFDKLIDSYLGFYSKDEHSERENNYPELNSKEYLQNLSTQDFVEYIFQFTRVGGGIQSGGPRTAGRLKEEIENDFDYFKNFLLKPYEDNFDVNEWLNSLSNYKFIGLGLSTIFLNRIDKNRFVIVNEKSKEALRIMGYDIKNDPVGSYNSIKSAQDDLLSVYPQLQNYYIADFLNHYLIATDEGKKFYENLIDDMIENYKKLKRSESHASEFYKYEAIQHFQNSWEIDANDFFTMLKEALKKQTNLMYPLSHGTILSVAENFPEQARGLFEYLFDEIIDLKIRIKTFSEKIDYFKKQIKPTDSGFQDERAISVYLTFMYPHKYTYYKYSYYSKYCKLIDVKEKPTGDRYIHYLQLIENFIKNYINDDNELWSLTNGTLPDSAWPDNERIILAQDILFKTMENVTEPKYWIFQGNPKYFDVAGALKQNALKTWKVAAHKDKIALGDKVILWLTGEKSGCYALASVKTDVEQRLDDPVEKKFYTKRNEDELAEKVELKIEHNLWDKPVLAEELRLLPEFKNFKGGYRGTNFISTKEQYDKIVDIKSEHTNHELKSPDAKYSVMNIPENLILYGPPGTGKTYRLVNNYIKFFVDESENKSIEVYTYELISDLLWWEVITLCMLDIEKGKVNDMIKHPLLAEKINQSKSTKPRNTIWYYLQNHTKQECPNVNVANTSDVQIFWKDENSIWSIDKNKTEETLPDLVEKFKSWKNYVPTNSISKRYEMITFHQSYSYEEFVEGIRPDLEEEDELKYKIEPGVFLRIAEKARKDSEKSYAIFIDEINRGNISKIFGDLITLIEPDKRQNGEHPIEVTLPYSKSKFTVPSNLYIIGTMNTADRSIALIDTALRRRFHFKEMMPDSSLLVEDLEGINLQLLLDKINERIEFLLDRDHTIGHSYLINIYNKNELCRAFKDKIIPLLQEYFYNDWEKIQLVLGDNDKWGKEPDKKLVKIKKHYSVNVEKELFGFDIEDYEDETIYEITPALTNDEFDLIPHKAFIYIYQKPETKS